MDDVVWERVSASFIQHSREDACMQAYATYIVTFKKGTVPCL